MSDRAYKKIKSMWHDETFRLHIASKHREIRLKEIDTQILRFQTEKKKLESESILPYAKKQGKSVKHLKDLLDWDDQTIQDVMSSHSKSRKHQSMGKYIYKLLESLMT